jgi:hypothetical protein
MSSTRSDQSPRVYWFQQDLGEPGDTPGWRYVDPVLPTPSGDHIFVVDLTRSLGGGSPWQAALINGLSIYPNSSAVGYQVSFDWIRLTTADANAASPTQQITWSGGSGNANIDVIDAAGTTFRVASGVSGTSFSWKYGYLPPGTYTLTVTRGGVATDRPVSFKINASPTIKVTSPDETGGEDFATAVLGNAWDMSDSGDYRFDNGATIVDHLLSRSVSGGQFHGTSDGASVATTPQGIRVGDPQLYVLSSNGVIDTKRYRYLTYRLQVDHAYDVGHGSVARVFWGSQSGPGSPYNLTTSKDIIVWPGMNSYTIDLASLSTTNGGLETGNATPWTAANVRHFRIDPFEFAQQVAFHVDSVKLSAIPETQNNRFTIKFAASDPDAGDSPVVNLYYDTDANPASGLTPIATNVPAANGQFVWNTAAVAPGLYYIYANVTDGKNVTGGYASGQVRVIQSGPATNPQMNVDSPANGNVLPTFTIAGWAADLGAESGTGVDLVHIYAYPNPGSGQAPLFLGAASYGINRSDIGTAFGAQFAASGYSKTVNSLAPGPYLLVVYAHSTVSGVFQQASRTITVQPGSRLSIETPAAGSSVTQPFSLSGWALDMEAPSGTGVDTLHVWAYPNPGSGAAGIFVGAVQYGIARPDVGAAYGGRFTNSGYRINVKGLAPGPYQFTVYLHSTATGTFRVAQSRVLNVAKAVSVSVDAPAANSSRTPPFLIAGWAVDFAAASGTGIDAVHVWAYPNPGSGAAAIFLGAANYGLTRTDVGAAFGAQYTASGYTLNVPSLAHGTYDIAVFPHSSVSGAFDAPRVVRITVP